MTRPYDLVVVGAGILGLAHAFAASRIGKRVLVIDRDARANGASIRNFGFVTVTGQERGASWRRARRSRDIWAATAAAANIRIEQTGLWVSLRYPESLAVADAFLATEMGAGCRMLGDGERDALPFPGDGLLGVLHSSHDLRVDSRLAIPRLASWLAERQGVSFMTGTAVYQAHPPRVETSRGSVEAAAVVVCPGDDLVTLFPDRIAARGVRRCSLSMLRLADPGFRLTSAVMSDLGLARYRGYADLPEAGPLIAMLSARRAAALEHGVHLIVTQGADGALVVGDSHHYDETADPFMRASVETLILQEFQSALGIPAPPALERWTGVYASADSTMFVDAPGPNIRLAMVTSGTGASTAFAIAEEVIGEMFDRDLSQIPLIGAS